MANVVIYSAPECIWCKRAKEFFKENKIEYKDIDVSDPEKAKEMVEKSGQTGTPVIFVDEEMLIGFDEEKLKGLLKL